MISECDISSVEIVGPPSCDTSCDTGCSSDICFTETSGAWTDGPVCSNGTSVCCCEEDCSDYHAEILSEYTGIDKDLIKYVIGGGGIAFLALIYRLKKQFSSRGANEGGVTTNSNLTLNCCCKPALQRRVVKEEEEEEDNKFEDVQSEEKEENIMP
tara:strand:+ start:67 stop:534 length:468 start_codon:yes stop_codon:yes gene_type:complete